MSSARQVLGIQTRSRVCVLKEGTWPRSSKSDGQGGSLSEICLNQEASEQETGRPTVPPALPGTPWPVAAMGHLSSARMCQWDLD